jgi:tetratricopeptide (TPR) repeat protein
MSDELQPRPPARRRIVEPMPSLEETLLLAVQSHQSGDLAEGERLYRRILAVAPNHPDALHLLGVVAHQQGRRDEAVKLMRKSLARRPDDAHTQYHYGHALLVLERREAALAAYAEAARLGLDHAELHYNLGVVLRDLKRSEEAVVAFKRAVERKSDYVEASNNLGVELHALERFEEAVMAYRAALAVRPDYAEAHHNLALSLRQLGRLDDALDASLTALRIKPDYADAGVGLGNILQDLGRSDEAIAAYRRTVTLSPGYAEARNNLAIALQEAGRSQEALAETHEALVVDPRSAHAWYIRADLKPFKDDDPDLAEMEALLATADAAGMEALDRMRLHFALGKAWMDAGDADRAFIHLNAGNALKRRSIAYDVAADAGEFAATAEVFSPQAMKRLGGAGESSSQPVFIIGLPRSGSTLVEQILASHSRVCAVGETSRFANAAGSAGQGALTLFPGGIARLPPEGFSGIGRRYLADTPAAARGYTRVIDKTLSNFRFAGLIRLALPNARIIHCRRDPRDTGLSCYARMFAGRQDFAYDLAEFGAYCRAYASLMEHWRSLLPPDRFTEIDYEHLVDDVEGEARRLVDFLGLDWEEACLSFHKTERQVRTASVNQVRKPLFRDSVGRWRRYAGHLEPLLAALQLRP